MYIGLREGLRAATHVELQSWQDTTTHEVVDEVVRYGKVIWRRRTADIVLVQGGRHALNHLRVEHREYGDKEVNKILDKVDWDEFFPIEINEEPEEPQDDRPNHVRIYTELRSK